VTDQPQPITVYDPEGSPVSVGGRTVDDQAARVAELADEWANRHGLEAFVVKFRDTLDTMVTNHWRVPRRVQRPAMARAGHPTRCRVADPPRRP
jgi:hypothetical protein